MGRSVSLAGRPTSDELHHRIDLHGEIQGQAIHPDGRAGVAAGIACGLGARYIGGVIAVGGAAGAAVVVGACLIMLIDAFST